MAKILGINCFSHDTAACLLDGGRIVAFAEEERFVREKHTKNFPDESVRYCLAEAGLSVDDIDFVAFTYRPLLDFSRALLDFARSFPRGFKRLAVQAAFDGLLIYRPRKFRKVHGYTGKMKFIGHHDAHAASAYYPSGFREAAILSIDRGGDYLSTLLAHGEGGRIGGIKKIRNPHSVGALYTAVTEHLGFRPNSGEGKVMGLAPYGGTGMVEEFRKLVRLEPEGDFKLDLSYFQWEATSLRTNDKFSSVFGPARVPESDIAVRHEELARALQEVTEEMALHLGRYLYERTRSPRLCIAGGVGLNSVMNARLLRELPFEDIFIQPAAGDAGAALGAAYWVEHMMLGTPPLYEMQHAFYGPGFTDEEIRQAITRRKVAHRRVEDPCAEAARALSEGKIVGWFQGRMEMGPRALGNRSILADPRGPDMKDKLNREVKHREGFRPFAPSLLPEYGEEYFDGYHDSPFMLLVVPFTEQTRDRVPAVVHVDGTGRLQTLDADSNPLYSRLVEEFHGITGVPLVLNTSFNVRGEPIVLSPDDALNCFFATGIDVLVIGEYLLTK